jgi:hypothetical protein
LVFIFDIKKSTGVGKERISPKTLKIIDLYLVSDLERLVLRICVFLHAYRITEEF